MKNIIEVQKKIIPQAIELMEKRYAVLRQIAISQPIGRRMLANVLNLSERTTRTEVDFLKSQKMIDISVSGMTLTEEGKEVIAIYSHEGYKPAKAEDYETEREAQKILREQGN